MAIITAKAVTGNFSVGTNWVGDVAPTAGDTAVIPVGATITVDVATPVLGSNASAVGHGVTVQSGGTLLVAATLNANGYDAASNTAVYVAPGGTLQRATGGNIVVTPASSWQTIILNEGDFIWDGGTIESGEPWTFVDVGITLTNYVAANWKQFDGAGIAFFPVGTSTSAASSSCVTNGPISNAAGTSVGTPFDNSFSVVSITSPSLAFTNEVASIEELLSAGDYFVDCPNGIVYYINTQGTQLTVTYTCKTHKWLGFGIHSIRNGDSKFLLDNATLRRLGGNWGSHSTEYTQQSILLRYRVNSSVNPAREGRIRDCVFEYCIIPVQAYNSTNSASNKLQLTGNTFKWTPVHGGNYRGIFLLGYASHIDTSRSVFDTVSVIASWWGRGATGVVMSEYSGMAQVNSFFGDGAAGCIAENSNMRDAGGFQDSGGFQHRGNSTSGPNVYRGHTLHYGNRAGRVGSYMTVENNEFVQYQHHGFVAPTANGFFTNIKIKNNITRDVALTGNMGGGWTLGYNYLQWLDDVEIDGNTFYTGNRSIIFNDGEGTKVLGTRLKIWNNNLTNAYQGITQPAADASNQTKKQILRLDYNNEYGMTNAGNVKQGTPVKSSVEYNLDSSRNVNGIALFNPSAPSATGKALSLVVSGTPGTDFSMLLSWGGGTAVELVSAQGTATGGTGATNHNTPGTIVDSSKAWTTDAVRLDQGKIVSGTGANQHFMVRTNNATTLTVMPNVEAGTFTAPSTDSVYIVLKSDVQLSDGTQTVEAGLYIPEVPLTAGTYTDTGITFESNALAVDPAYTSATDLTPTNLTLLTAGFDGGYIGALEPRSADDTAPVLTSPTATATGPTTATASVTTDDGNGTLYFLASENTTESAATVKAALSQSVTTAGEQSISLSALDPETAYYVHFVHINGAGLESDVVSTNVITTPAIVYPEISATVAASSTSAVSATVTTDTAGGTIYGVLSTSATEMEATDIKSGADDSATVTDAGDYTIGETGLATWTQYYWHIVHEDGAGLMSNVLTIPVRTLDISIPLAFSGTAPATLLTVQVWSKMPKKADVEGLY